MRSIYFPALWIVFMFSFIGQASAYCLMGGAGCLQNGGASWPSSTATFGGNMFGALPANQQATAASFNTTFRQAALSWNNHSNFSYVVSNTAISPCSVRSNATRGWAFSASLCGGTAFGASTLAVTQTWRSVATNALVDADIVFNQSFVFDVHATAFAGTGSAASAVDFTRVAAHELGHALGLGHENLAPALMQPVVGNIVTPQTDDINGLIALYGGGAGGGGGGGGNGDLHGGSIATATRINPTSTTSGSINFAGDNDYFRIVIPSAGSLTINTTGTTDTVGYLLDNTGRTIAFNDDAGGTLRTNFRINSKLSAGTYYIRIRHFRTTATFGTYSLISTFTSSAKVVYHGDFNGDGKADVLFHQPSTGKNFIMLMNGKQPIAMGFVKRLATSWSIASTADFNGDGKSDILFHQATTGKNFMMFMNGTRVVAMGFVKRLGTSWVVAATGDFNGDGKADILFHQASTGKNFMMLMNGRTPLRGGMGFVKRLNASWNIVGAADFNGDGKSDILFHQAATGKNFMMLMNGKRPLAGGMGFVKRLTTSWSMAGTGDFNGDGKADILFHQASTGKNFMMLMNGKTPLRGGMGFVKRLATSWSIAGTGDFNGDGKADILFHQASTGKNFMMLMNGKTPLRGGMGFMRRLAPSWQVSG